MTPHPTDESELTEPLHLTAEPPASPLTATLDALRREQEHVQHLVQHALHHKRWHEVGPLQRLGSALAQAIHRCNEAAQEIMDDLRKERDDMVAKLTAERDEAQAEATRLHKALEVAEEKYAHWQLQAMEYKTASVERTRERDAARIQRDDACAEINRLHADMEKLRTSRQTTVTEVTKESHAEIDSLLKNERMILQQRDDARKQAEDRRRDLNWQNGMWADLARILGSDTRHPPTLLKELEMRREPSEEMANELAELRTERQLWHKEMSERDEGWRTGWEKVQDHDRKWMEAMAILGMTGDLIGPDDVLAELRRRMPAPPSCAGTGPVAVPALEVEPGDLRGLQNKVSEHSRTIGDLKDECRALREKIAAMALAVHAQGKAR